MSSGFMIFLYHPSVAKDVFSSSLAGDT